MKYFFFSILLYSLSSAVGATLSHGQALFGELKYPANFKHFDYVNAKAPKGGQARFAAMGSFDNFNPFIIKGEAAAGLMDTFDTLMVASADEPFSQYGLIAQRVETDPNGQWVTFYLRPEARFHDGSSIQADDVVFSFNQLKNHGQPFYRFYYRHVDRVEALAPLQVRFHFDATANREIPLIVGQMPILSRQSWQNRDFGATTLKPVVGSGPYQLQRWEAGRYVVYQRDENYWAKDLPVRKGFFNLNTIRYDYYRDSTVALEAFKADRYDIRPENIARVWVTGYDFPAVKQGKVLKKTFKTGLPSGMQSFVFNLRRDKFKDRQVRKALGLVFDFEWTNRNIFFDQYLRSNSYFVNSDLASHGLPQGQEKLLLTPYADQLPSALFTQPFVLPVNGSPAKLRHHMRQAIGLLKQAGWIYRNQKLVHGKTNQPFTIEFLTNSPTWERIVLPYARHLERLGIELTVRTVDSAQYQQRLNQFDFDMVVGLWPQSLSPGNEQRSYWGSEAANIPGSRNLAGIADPVVDDLIDQLVQSSSRQQLITRTHALDRVLLWRHYMIPNWYYPYQRLAWWDRFGYPDATSLQGVILQTWWAKPAQ